MDGTADCFEESGFYFHCTAHYQSTLLLSHSFNKKGHFAHRLQLSIPAPFVFSALQPLPFYLRVEFHSTALKEQISNQDVNTTKFLEVSLIRKFIVEPPLLYPTSTRYHGIRRVVLGQSKLTMVTAENLSDTSSQSDVEWAGAIVWNEGKNAHGCAGYGGFEGGILSAQDRIVVLLRYRYPPKRNEAGLGLAGWRSNSKPELQEFTQDVRIVTDLSARET